MLGLGGATMTARHIALAAVVLASAVAAQNLELDARGGSTPGVVQLDAYPALYPFEAIMRARRSSIASAIPTPSASATPARSAIAPPSRSSTGRSRR